MKRSIIISLLISLALVFSAHAQTTSSPTVEELQKQIQLLLSQMSSLQKEVTTLRSTTPAPTTSVTTPTIPTPTAVNTVPPSILPVYTPLDIDESEVTGTETTFTPPPTLTRSLFRGSRGEDVRQLQEFLAQDPSIYPEAIANGYYGTATERAVRKWQAKNGVPSVGIIGRQTIAKFKQIYPPGVTVFPRPTVPDDTIVVRPSYCPVYAYMPVCKEDQSSKDTNGCQVCQQRPTTDDVTKPTVCPALATVDACPAGEERIVTYKSQQCGVYYACKPREISRADNTIATLKKTSSIQTDNRYSVNLYDPEGVQKFAVYNTKGFEIHLSYPACRRDWSSPVFNADSSEFPLKLTLTDCASSQYSTALSTPVIVKQVSEGLTFPYKFSSGKIVYSSEEARSYCYANGPGSGQSVAAECETKFGVVYTNVTTTTTSSGRAIYLTDAFGSCMAKYGFSAESKQIKTWAQSSEAIPWSTLTNAAQNAVPVCEREYYGQQTVEVGSVLCSDSKDNDGDGFVDMADPSCSYTTTTVAAGQKEQAWNSLGLKSWIRTDADSARVDQLKAACASVPSGSNIWTPNAGLSSSADFGMPDASKCQRASSCTSSQRFDGAACVANTTTTTTAQCSDGKDNDGDGLIDYPSDTGCYSKDDYDETPGTSTTTTDCSKYGSGWHTMGSDGNCFDTNMTSYRTTNGTLYSCSTTSTSGCSGTTTTTAQCSDGRDNDGDGLIDYPSDAGCYSSADNDETFGSTTTTSSSCDSALTALLGTGCHYMYNDSAGNQTYCDGPMTRSAKRGDTATTAGCSSPSTTTAWPTDQTTCTSKGYNWCVSTTSWCQTGSCPTATTGGTTYAGDANSCPGFAYSRWDSSSPSRRYCQLNTESRCDYNYPSYLTNGANYTAANCPTTTSVGSDTSTWCSPLGSGWSVYGNYCLNSSRTQYAPVSSPNSSSVQACAGTDSPVTGCTPPSGSTTTTTTTTTTSTGSCSQYGEGWHVMGDNNCYNSGMTEYRTANGTLYSCSSTPSSGCSSSSSSYTGSGACTSGQYWNGTACVTSTTSSSPSCSTPSTCYDSAICASSGWYWYNNGCWSSPQSSTTSSTSSTTCPSGQYWSGTACVSSTTTTCASGQYWNGSSCVTSTTSSSNTTCASGQYWNGTACVNTSTTDCASGQYWNGSSCVSSTPSAAVYDQLRIDLRAMEIILRGLLGR